MPWTERDVGVVSDNDEQGGWDPWWFTPQKQGTSNPDYAIVWRCQVGAIYRSVDLGQNWIDVTPLTDPSNDWGDSPAPAATNVTYVQRVDNIHINKWHCFLARWQNGAGEWRSWLLLTTDDGVTWTWQSLYEYASGGNVIANGHFTNNCLGWSFCEGGGCHWDGSRLRMDKRALSATYTDQVCDFDAGTYLLVGDFDRGDGYTGKALVNIIGAGALEWFNPDTGPKSMEIVMIAGPNTVRLTCNYQHSGASTYGWWDDVYMFLIESALESYVIWADVDSEDGTTMYLTIWIDGNLYIQVIDTATLSITDGYSLGAATIGEVTAKTYIAYPMTPLGDKGYCVVHGRMNAPAGLAGVQHIIETRNGAVSWRSVESGWGADRCCALQVGAQREDGSRPYYAIRSGNAGAPAQFHYGLNGLAFAGNLPFANNVSVYVDAMSIAGNGNIAVGADTAGAIMVVQSTDVGATWVDITDNYPVIGTVSSLTYL